MKFKTNDILENRNGTQVLITIADQPVREYHYKYLNITDPQFQGMFCHSADNIERYWHLANRTIPISANQNVIIMDEPFEGLNEFQSRSRLNRQGQSCAHELKEYIGFTNKFKYCTKCDQKFET